MTFIGRVFFTIWVLDSFLYSNTETFLIFAIFSSFGVLFVTIFSTYSNYLNELIIEENIGLYTLMYALRYKFSTLLKYNRIYPGAAITGTWNKYYSGLPAGISTILLVHFLWGLFSGILVKKLQLTRYFKFLKFTKVILRVNYTSDYLKIKEFVVYKFSNFSNTLSNVGSVAPNFSKHGGINVGVSDSSSLNLISWFIINSNFAISISEFNFTLNFPEVFFQNFPIFTIER